MPGVLYLIVPDAGAAAEHADAHRMDPMTVLQMVKAFRGETATANPGRVLLVGCELESCEERVGLSDSVERAVERAVTMIEDLVRKESQTQRRDSSSMEI
jgi:hydrogenase maturation protease